MSGSSRGVSRFAEHNLSGEAQRSDNSFKFRRVSAINGSLQQRNRMDNDLFSVGKFYFVRFFPQITMSIFNHVCRGNRKTLCKTFFFESF